MVNITKITSKLEITCKIARIGLYFRRIASKLFKNIATKNWLKIGKGILQHATGSGKTITSILIMKRLIEKNLSNFFLVLVPQSLLLYQWEEEIEKWMPNSKILLSVSLKKRLHCLTLFFVCLFSRYSSKFWSNKQLYKSVFKAARSNGLVGARRLWKWNLKFWGVFFKPKLIIQKFIQALEKRITWICITV